MVLKNSESCRAASKSAAVGPNCFACDDERRQAVRYGFLGTSDVSVLLSLGVSGGQGYLFGKPQQQISTVLPQSDVA